MTTDPNPLHPKWVLFSLTMWGSIVMTVTAGLPAVNVLLNTFFGWSIEPELVAQLDQAVKALIMGVGTIVGLVMIIKGRLNAKQPLTLVPPKKATLPVIFLALILVPVLLAGCFKSDTLEAKADKVIEGAVNLCGFKPLRDGVLAMLTAANPTFAGVKPIVTAICAAATAYSQTSVQSLMNKRCIMVNGICVEGEWVNEDAKPVPPADRE